MHFHMWESDRKMGFYCFGTLFYCAKDVDKEFANAAKRRKKLRHSSEAVNECRPSKLIYQLMTNSQSPNMIKSFRDASNCNILFRNRCRCSLNNRQTMTAPGYRLNKSLFMQSKQYRNGYTYILWNIFIISGKVSLDDAWKMPQSLFAACLRLSFVNSIDFIQKLLASTSSRFVLADFIYLFNVRLLENKKKKKKRQDYCLEMPATKKKEPSLSSSAQLTSWHGKIIRKSAESSRGAGREGKVIEKSILCNAFAGWLCWGTSFYRVSFSSYFVANGWPFNNNQSRDAIRDS